MIMRAIVRAPGAGARGQAHLHRTLRSLPYACNPGIADTRKAF